jgi:hypothetical protein
MKARRFNEMGLQAFAEYITAARTNHRARLSVEAVPEVLVSGAEFTELTDYELPDEAQAFPDKLAIGQLFTRVIPVERNEEARLDVGLWSWFAARYFDQITSGRKKIKEERAYVASISFQDFYRHLILGPYYLYFTAQDDPERVRVLLYDDPTTMNEVMVQFGSYQTLMQNKELQSLIQKLYYDVKTKRIKRGAGGKEAGTPRRLMDFFNQIGLNYDLRSITENRFWDILPGEFAKFKGQPEDDMA